MDPVRRASITRYWNRALDRLTAELNRSSDSNLTLYGHPMSVTTRQVLTLLAEKGCSPQFRVVDVMAHEQKKAEHLSRHPFGLLPVLDDHGFVLYEVHAILRYVDSAMPGPVLTPQDEKARARIDQWLSIEHSYLHPAVKKCLARGYADMMGLDDPGPGIVEEGKREAIHLLDVFVEELVTGHSFASDGFTLAHLCWLADLNILQEVGLHDLLAERPEIERWLQVVGDRPAWKETLRLVEPDHPGE
jgi:glutathione S-transferase